MMFAMRAPALLLYVAALLAVARRIPAERRGRRQILQARLDAEVDGNSLVESKAESAGEATAQTASRSNASAEKLPLGISNHLVWLEYLFPSGAWWDFIHDGHVKDGGLWHYGHEECSVLERFVERRHPSYSSLWDLASNQGFLLKRLATKHPGRKFYGSDISAVMVNATKTQCPTCKAEVFDISALQSRDFSVTPGHLPEPVDIIVVADVIVYMSWGGWPPILNTILPTSWTRTYRENFWYHLTHLARKEVIFNNNQGNLGVLRFLEQMGATRIEENGAIFWVAPGAYGRHDPLPEVYESEDIFVRVSLIVTIITMASFCILTAAAVKSKGKDTPTSLNA